MPFVCPNGFQIFVECSTSTPPFKRPIPMARVKYVDKDVQVVRAVCIATHNASTNPEETEDN